MGRKLTWQDVLNSLPEHDKVFYAQAHVEMCNAARYDAQRSIEIADEIQKWELIRWDAAEFNIAATKAMI